MVRFCKDILNYSKQKSTASTCTAEIVGRTYTILSNTVEQAELPVFLRLFPHRMHGRDQNAAYHSRMSADRTACLRCGLCRAHCPADRGRSAVSGVPGGGLHPAAGRLLLRRVFRRKGSASARHPLREPCRIAARGTLVCGRMHHRRNAAQSDAALRPAPGGRCGRHPWGEHPAPAHKAASASAGASADRDRPASAAPPQTQSVHPGAFSCTIAGASCYFPKINLAFSGC